MAIGSRTQTEAGTTETEAALRALRGDILSGALQPDTKLKMRVLKERYGFGGSPMREALAQLAARGFVLQLPQRGFRVPPISAAQLDEITRSRQLVEPEAVKLAIAHGGAEWEDRIVASFHLFVRQQWRAGGAPAERDIDTPGGGREARHHEFHRALISACPLEPVKEFCDRLYQQTTRYRLLLRGYQMPRDAVVAEHELLMEAVLSRNPGRAAEAIRKHIGITADMLVGVLTAGEGRRPRGDRPSRPSRSVGKAKFKTGRKR